MKLDIDFVRRQFNQLADNPDFVFCSNAGGSYVANQVNTVSIAMKFVVFARKNAKIAGIDKQINFSRVDIEWLDLKFKKNSVDKKTES